MIKKKTFVVVAVAVVVVVVAAAVLCIFGKSYSQTKQRNNLQYLLIINDQ